MESTKVAEFKRRVQTELVQMDEVARKFEMALALKKPILLYGPPGQAKSEIVNIAAQTMFGRKQPFVVSMGPGTTPSQLFGDALIAEQVLTEGGNSIKQVSVSYDGNTSMLNEPIVCLEEGLDGPPKILLMLKDLLTRGEQCFGAFCMKNGIELMVMCTNIAPSDWVARQVHTDSSQAFIDRFITVEVGWKTYTAYSYLELFRKVDKCKHLLKKEELAETFALLHMAGHTVSPRLAVHAASVWGQFGEECLEAICQVPKPILDVLKQKREQLKGEAVLGTITVKLDQITELSKHPASLETKLDWLKTCQDAHKALGNLRLRGELYDKAMQLRNEINPVVSKIATSLTSEMAQTVFEI